MSTIKDPQQKKAPVIQINQEVLHNNLSGYVRKNLENILNELLDAEADRLCHAKRYERNAERASTRAGSYKRNFETTSGKVTLNIPKLRNLPFETAIIERYRRRESSIEEAMMEMYLAGVSVRRVEDITEALWGAGVSAGTISNLNKKIYGSIEGEFSFQVQDGQAEFRSSSAKHSCAVFQPGTFLGRLFIRYIPFLNKSR